MRKIGRYSRSGLASIVTTAIMLTAVAIMGSGVVVWGKSNLAANEISVASSTITSINRINENLAIEKIWFGINGTQKFVNVTMSNNGNIGLNVAQIQFSNSSTSNQFQFNNQAFLPKQTGSIQIPYSYSKNIPITILITTARGSIFTTQATLMKKQNLLTITNIIFVNLTAHLEFSSSYRNHYRRGLASIVTTAIMLSSVAVIGATTVSWSQSNLSAREQALGSKDGSIINQIKESLVLEHFWYDTPNQKLNLILKNTGTIGLHVIEIRIDGPTSQDTPITNAGILPDGIYAASVHYTWLGAPIDVFVTTDRGSIFRTHLVSPTDGVLIINKVSKLGNGNFSYNGDLGNFYIPTAGWSTGANLDKNGNLIMSGVIRDFNGSADSGDSLIGRDPDFEMICPCPFGLYPGIVLPNLGSDHTPVYNNQTNSH